MNQTSRGAAMLAVSPLRRHSTAERRLRARSREGEQSWDSLRAALEKFDYLGIVFEVVCLTDRDLGFHLLGESKYGNELTGVVSRFSVPGSPDGSVIRTMRS